MSEPDEEDLPLQDEAEARPKWRDGETLIGRGEGASGPASEIDNAAEGGGTGALGAGDTLLRDLAKRPPD